MGKKRKHGILVEIFDAIDLFNDPIRLKLHGKRALTTTLGGVLTIAIVIFIISQISTEFVTMFNYDNPQVYEISELEDNPAAVPLNQDTNFFIAVVLVVNSNNVNMSQASVLNFQTTYNVYTRLNNGSFQKNKYPVYWAPCNQSDFPDDVYGTGAFAANSLNYGYCTYGIDFTDSNGTCPDYIVAQYPDCVTPLNFTLQGTNKNDNFNFFQCIGVTCDSSDPTLPYGMVCDTPTNVNTAFTTGEVKKNIYYPYSLINPQNYKDPNVTFIDNIYWNLNPSIYKISDIFVDRVTIQDFDSWMWDKAYNNRSYYSIPSDKMRELEEFQSTSTSQLINWSLRRSNLNTVVSRTYSKITTILTDLGGFAKAMMFMAAAIAIGFIRFRYNMIIANELYDFKFPEEMNEKPAKPVKKDKQNMMLSIDYSDNKILAHHHEAPSFSSPRADFIPNKPIREYSEKLNMRKRRLDQSEWGFTKMLWRVVCCKKMKEEDLGRKARELASKEIDIIKLVKKLKEVERIKFLLFNPSQRRAFEFMERPLVTLQSKKPIHMDSLNGTIRSASKKFNLQNRSHSHTKEISFTSDTIQVYPELPDADYSSLSQYGRLYVSYRYLLEDLNPKNTIINRKLLGTLGNDLLRVFRRVDQLMEDEPDAKQFEEIIKQVLDADLLHK